MIDDFNKVRVAARITKEMNALSAFRVIYVNKIINKIGCLSTHLVTSSVLHINCVSFRYDEFVKIFPNNEKSSKS